MNFSLSRIFTIGLFCLISLNVFSELRPVSLKCEYKYTPVGIDIKEPRFSWIIDSELSGVSQVAYRLCISNSKEALQSQDVDIWDTGMIKSQNNTSVIFPGLTPESGKKYYWKVRIWDESGRESDWSDIAEFSTGLLSPNEWEGSEWIGYESLQESMKVIPFVHGRGESLGNKLQERAVIPYFRKTFVLDKQVAEAYAFVSGLGQYEFSLNGEKASDDFLVPGWTNYNKRCLYNSYDVTGLLQKGENVIGCLVGTGFFYINRERYRKITGAYGFPMLRLVLYVRFSDGTMDKIVTDDTWKTFPSPIEYTSIYGGEDYNANKECIGWNRKGFDDSDWKNVVTAKGPGGIMKAQVEYPVKVMENFDPVAVIKPAPGKYIYDFGQNASGIIELKVKGQKGDTVKITPAELLDDDGLANQRSSGSPYYFQYILKGDSIETWKPRFTYYGFRYAMVDGAIPESEKGKKKSQVVNLKLLHIRNSMPGAGTFECSNHLFNQIFSLIDWSVKSNTVSVSTDCPHREKLGWLEQSFLMGESVKYNYDVFHLYNKILDDMMESQAADGMVPTIAPEYVWFEGAFRDSPGWGSAMIFVPWYLYKWYGDKHALERSYNNMVRYIAYLSSKAKSNILSYGLGDWLDVGPKSPGFPQLTPISLTATAFYYYDVLLMSKIAEVTENTNDMAKYSLLAASIRKSFNKKFFEQKEMCYASGSQTSYAIPLYMGIVNGDDYEKVVENLKKSILSEGRKITAGDIGHRFLVQSLRQAGESQLLFDMNNRTDAGYGYQIKKGATALNENWSGEGDLSQNHMILGHLMEWFYNGLAGIRQQDDDVGYKSIIIEPQLVRGIDWMNASYTSMYGKIAVYWEKNEKQFKLKIHIPGNSEAKVILPVNNPKYITANGNLLAQNDKAFKNISIEEAGLSLMVGSGEYEFVCNFND